MLLKSSDECSGFKRAARPCPKEKTWVLEHLVTVQRSSTAASQRVIQKPPLLDMSDSDSVCVVNSTKGEGLYLQSTKDARVLHALVCGQLSKAPAKDVEMPQNLGDRTHTHTHLHTNWGGGVSSLCLLDLEWSR